MNTSVSGSARSQIHSTVEAIPVAQPASRTWPEDPSATTRVSLTSPQAASAPLKITRRHEQRLRRPGRASWPAARRLSGRPPPASMARPPAGLRYRLDGRSLRRRVHERPWSYSRSGRRLALAGRHILREPEARKQLGTEEGGDLGDPLAVERQHGDAARQEALPLLVPAVVPERQLPVRPGRHEAPAVFARQHMALRERAVGGEHLDDGVDVGALEGVDVAVDDLAHALVVERTEHRLLAAVGKPFVDGLVGALQGAVDGGRRHLQRPGRLARREPEHVAEDEHGALARRQVLERRDKGELDALALLVTRLRTGESVLEAEPLVGIGLEPDRFDQW